MMPTVNSEKPERKNFEKFISNPSLNGNYIETSLKQAAKNNNTSHNHPETDYMANRPQKALHDDEVETSELHRSTRTTP